MQSAMFAAHEAGTICENKAPIKIYPDLLRIFAKMIHN
jgi:hypothetical protein